MELFLLIAGMIALLGGRIVISNNFSLEGDRARIFGGFLVAPWVIAFASGVVIGGANPMIGSESAPVGNGQTDRLGQTLVELDVFLAEIVRLPAFEQEQPDRQRGHKEADGHQGPVLPSDLKPLGSPLYGGRGKDRQRLGSIVGPEATVACEKGQRGIVLLEHHVPTDPLKVRFVLQRRDDRAVFLYDPPGKLEADPTPGPTDHLPAIVQAPVAQPHLQRVAPGKVEEQVRHLQLKLGAGKTAASAVEDVL